MTTRCFRCSALAAMVLMCAVLAGCTDIHEMKYQSFITAIGLDRTDEHDIKVSILKLLFDQQSQGLSASDESSRQNQASISKVVSVGCSYFPDCMERIRHQLSGRMTLDQVHYVLFGEKLLQSGVKPYIDYFYHIGEMEQTVKFFGTDQDVEAFMKKDEGMLVHRLIGGLQVHPSVFDVEMWEFAPKINTALSSAYLSLMKIDDDQLFADGLYLMKEDKLGMKLSLEDAFLLQFINGERVDELTFVFPDEQLAFQVHNYRMKLRVTPRTADVYVRATGWVIGGREYQSRTVLDGQDEFLAGKIEDRLEQVLATAHAKGIDYLGIGEKFRQKNWDTSDWQSQLENLNVNVHADIIILSGKAAQ